MSEAAKPVKRKRVNVRRPDVMTLVQEEVEKHYHSPIVEKLRDRGGSLTIGKAVATAVASPPIVSLPFPKNLLVCSKHP